MKRADYQKAAKELNKELELDPKIETASSDITDLKSDLKEAGSLLEKGDEVTKATADVLKDLGVDIPKSVKIKGESVKIKGGKAAPAKKGGKKTAVAKAPAKKATAKKAPAKATEKKEGVSKFGWRLDSAVGMIDELLSSKSGSTLKACAKMLKKEFPDRYPDEGTAMKRINTYLKVVKGERGGAVSDKGGVIKVK